MRGQSGLRARIDREVAEKYPDLDPVELARRCEAAYKAHMARLAFASAKARSAKAGPKNRTDSGGGSVAA